MTASPLLLATLLSLGLLSVATVGLVADQRTRKHDARVASVLSAYSPAVVRTASVGLGFGDRLLLWGPVRSLLRLLRVKREQPDLYPAPWWVIAAILLMVAVIVSALGSMAAGPMAWIALPVVWLLLMRTVFKSSLSRRAALLYHQFPDALTMIGRSVRAGLPVSEALRVVSEEGQAPTAAEFARLYDDLRLGGSLPEALVKMAQRSALLEYRFFAVALSLQSQSGGSLTETLDNLADVIRKRVAVKARALALASEAKMTMYVLAALPFIVGIGLTVLNPAYVSQLVFTSTGRIILAIGVGLLTMGIVSMRVIIRKSVS